MLRRLHRSQPIDCPFPGALSRQQPCTFQRLDCIVERARLRGQRFGKFAAATQDYSAISSQIGFEAVGNVGRAGRGKRPNWNVCSARSTGRNFPNAIRQLRANYRRPA